MHTILTPFRFDTAGGVAATSSDDVAARQRIVDYLLTSSSERFGLSDYGANLTGLTFSPADDLVKSDLRTDALPGMRKYISGVTVLNFDINHSDPFDSLVTVDVQYRIPLSPTKTLTFDVFGQLDEETPL